MENLKHQATVATFLTVAACSNWLMTTAIANAAWIDAATGQPVQTIPINGGLIPQVDMSDTDYAIAQYQHLTSNTRSGDKNNAQTNGRNLFWDTACHTWKDAATGKEVQTIPINGGLIPQGDMSDTDYAIVQYQHLTSNTRSGDKNHAQTNGRNLFWQPCPPPATQSAAVPSTGVYIGVNTGVSVPSSAIAWNPNFGAIDSPLVANAAMRTMSPTAFTVGGQIGIDFGGMATNPIGPGAQFGWTPDFVFGAVADFNVKTGAQTVMTPYVSPLGGGVFPMVQKFASPFEMTLRARVGVVIPVSPQLRVMPYVTGGLALATINTSDAMYFPTSLNFGSSSQFRPGWTIGGGVGIMPNSWPVRVQVQYLYEDFGSISYVAPNSAVPTSWIATNHRINAHRVTVGVNVPLSVFGIGQ